MATKRADKVKSERLNVKIEPYSSIGKLIKEYRKEKGITQKHFANLIHVSESSVRTWEQGKFLPSYDTYKLIKELLNDSV